MTNQTQLMQTTPHSPRRSIELMNTTIHRGCLGGGKRNKPSSSFKHTVWTTGMSTRILCNQDSNSTLLFKLELLSEPQSMHVDTPAVQKYDQNYTALERPEIPRSLVVWSSSSLLVKSSRSPVFYKSDGPQLQEPSGLVV